MTHTCKPQSTQLIRQLDLYSMWQLLCGSQSTTHLPHGCALWNSCKLLLQRQQLCGQPCRAEKT